MVTIIRSCHEKTKKQKKPKKNHTHTKDCGVGDGKRRRTIRIEMQSQIHNIPFLLWIWTVTKITFSNESILDINKCFRSYIVRNFRRFNWRMDFRKKRVKVTHTKTQVWGRWYERICHALVNFLFYTIDKENLNIWIMLSNKIAFKVCKVKITLQKKKQWIVSFHR